MAGSFNHIVDIDGGLFSDMGIVAMLDTGVDVFETIEQMYGMIWYMAYALEAADAYENRKDAIDEARVFYKEGLNISPTKRYKEE